MDESESQYSEGIARNEDTEKDSPTGQVRRSVNLYDAVAGRAGQNGFLTEEQLHSSTFLPAAPEDYLLRQTRIPEELLDDMHDPGGTYSQGNKLPESELLKAIHTYASDFYTSATANKGTNDFRSLDETALVALGILVEEAVKEALGENGDMVFVEPEGLEDGVEETKMTRHQIKGKVKLAARPTDTSDEDDVEEDMSPAKRQRR
ncbi:hypothetical protein EDD36DRAFT_231553 [Exophiala viscosa]|uniref:Uncharacterized protein n=1 Tax=Exophiala viscosa TaxID=2486360 RepID=A0AAN6E0W9_9EURO|nr:hypothetical protein EDD36DRAFT_231553 [Exophiala viscosa]